MPQYLQVYPVYRSFLRRICFIVSNLLDLDDARSLATLWVESSLPVRNDGIIVDENGVVVYRMYNLYPIATSGDDEPPAFLSEAKFTYDNKE